MKTGVMALILDMQVARWTLDYNADLDHDGGETWSRVFSLEINQLREPYNEKEKIHLNQSSASL